MRPKSLMGDRGMSHRVEMPQRAPFTGLRLLKNAERLCLRCFTCGDHVNDILCVIP